MRRLLLPLSVGVIAIGVLPATSLDDLISHTNPGSSSTTVIYRTDGTSLLGAPNPVPSEVHQGFWKIVMSAEMNVRTVSSGALSAAQWWRSAPTLGVAIATLALLAATVLAARRRGACAPEVGRLLGASAIVALLGGPLAVVIALVAPRLADGNWARTTLWPQALLWALIGGALLAVRELLARAAELHSELDGVI
jgi:hypothetical protein